MPDVNPGSPKRFDLNDAIEDYRRRVSRGSLASQSLLDELTDHLLCEVERRSGEGLAPEEAFRQAIAQLGPAEELAAEHAKNGGRLQACLVAEERLNQRIAAYFPSLGAKAIAALHIGAALAFAGALIAASTILEDPTHKSWAANGIIAAYFVPFSLLCILGSACEERLKTAAR